MSQHRPSRERRHFSRVSMDAPAQLRLADSERAVTVLDISLKGALIRMDTGPPPPPHEAGRLHIELAPGAEIVMECSVAHRAASHAGLHCTHIDIDSISHLRRLLELNLADPELINRELAEFASPET